MAYGEYANATNCPGWCLHQLSTIGVPVIVVESVIFAGNGHIQYRERPFASYEWLEDGTPYFTFSAYAPSCLPRVAGTLVCSKLRPFAQGGKMIRSLLFILLGWCTAGAIPRMIGLIGVQPQHATYMWWIDVVALAGLAIIILVIVWQWLLYDKLRRRPRQ